MLLCVRVFILEKLVQHFPVNTNIMNARRRWVLAQILPPQRHSEDLFVTVLRDLRGAETETETLLDIARESLSNIMTKRTDLFPEVRGTPLFVVIDDVQVAAETPKFFCSASGTELRPILREMVMFFHSSGIFNKIILSGSGLLMGVEDRRGVVSAKSV